MNIENIKSQFPILSKKINGKSLVYLDSSNSSQKPLSVINRLDEFYKTDHLFMSLRDFKEYKKDLKFYKFDYKKKSKAFFPYIF